MKLAAKLILVFMIGVFAIVGLFSWQTMRQQKEAQQRQREAFAKRLVDALQPAIIEAYREGGTVQIREAVQITTQHVHGTHLRYMEGKEFEPEMRVTTKRVTSLAVTDAENIETEYTYVPLLIDGTPAGFVEVAEPVIDDQQDYKRSLMASLISLAGVASLSALAIYWGGVWMVGRPLEKLIGQVKQIGDGELEQQPVLQTRDELGHLACAISHMSHRLSEQREKIEAEIGNRIEAQQQLRHADRLSTVGTLAAGVAHEMGTPLNVVAGRAGLIASGKLSSEETRQSALTIKSEAERMTTIIRQLLDFARQKNQAQGTMDLLDLVDKTCQMMQPLADKANTQIIQNKPSEPLMVHGDPAQLQQVVVNLINNAVQAIHGKGTIHVTCDTSPADAISPPPHVPDSPHGFACLEVSDDGGGIRPEHLQHIFEPFYTTKDVGQGTGLGLSIAYGIVRELGGWIAADSNPDAGTSFRVFLPKESNA
ncbi:Wide host range VirA protein [Roseimaritima multifibrata]|uniref:histidine kinase n=1 Tax=Roseimaritima multifibrata TaxID=1930274 RepID=A0A517MNV4_9BACT|nr:HAMP domain-containing sensor histidine kinase [Roseimaritima multifibrata]QDS96562.1 Wide host range VirA protein [Roseimaritima multifibrata]